MKRTLIISVVALICAMVMVTGCAKSAIPGRTRFLVNDYAHVLSDEAKTNLEKTLQGLKNDKNIQVEVIVSTFETTGGIPMGEFFTRYLNKWRRGFLFERDRRVHIIVITKDGMMRIGVGLGIIKDVSTDKISGIINNLMTPQFQKGNYEMGIRLGTAAVVNILSNDLKKR